MFSKISNLTGPFSSFSKGYQPRLMLSLDSYSYDTYNKDYTINTDNAGVTYSINSITSTNTQGGWDSHIYSNESYSGSVKLKFQSGNSSGFITVGFSENPTTGNTYDRTNYGIYIQGTNTIVIHEGPYDVYTKSGVYTTSTIYTIVYDGTDVRYFVDDVLIYVSNRNPNNPLYFYATFLTAGYSLVNIEFGDINTIWYDLSGNNRDFNLINSPNYVNSSFYFNSSASQSAVGSDLGALSKFTIDTWFNLKSLPISGANPQIVSNIFGGQDINFTIGLIDDTDVNGGAWTGKMMGGFYSGGWVNTDGFIPVVDTWYNAVLTYDQKHLDFYLNGNLYSSVASSIPVTTSGVGIRIGERWDTPEYIDGDIDIVKIWDGSLTSTQILNNYNSINPRYLTTDSSILLNGSTDWMEISKSNDWNLNNIWTIEFWSKSSTSSSNTIFSVLSQNPGDDRIDVFYFYGKLRLSNNREACNEPTPGVWTHVAIVSNSGSLTVFYDGVATYSTSGFSLGNTSSLAIGRRGPDTPYQYFNGELYGIRINNTAVYTSDFDPYDFVLPMLSIPGTVLLVDKYKPSINTFIDSSRRHNIINHGVTYSSDVPHTATGRYIRWIMTQTSGPDVNGDGAIQASELVLLYRGSTVGWNPSATASNPDGTNSDNEKAYNLLNSNPTKWCDYTFGHTSYGTSSIYIDNITPITFDSYYYVTGNDSPERDPITWTLAISNDNSNWRVIDTQISVGITSSRQSNTQIFTIN
jgi:hypothetical protein